MTLLFIIITVLYLILIGSFAFGFDKVIDFKLEDIKPKTGFSVVIPFRNEAENLAALLTSIAELNYPRNLFEIILVDDASEDDSVKIIEHILDKKTFANNFSQTNYKNIQIKIIQNNRTSLSPKKDAITSAIKTAKNDWIITTDADCELPKYWLDSFDAFIQRNKPVFIVAPVTYQKINGFLGRFQLLDFLSLIGATIGGFGIKNPFLCNGANLAYSKAFFKKANGFNGNTTIASGDDIFLLEKALKEDKKSVHFLKSEHSIVRTIPQNSWSDLIAQRKRWAAKTSSYNSVFGKLTGVLVLLMNATIICAFIFALIGEISPKLFIYIFIIKCCIDFLLLFKTSLFFNQGRYLNSFIFSSLLYPFFNVYVASISLFTSYKWKGREFRK